jgi:hypothetical protein
MNGTAAIAPFTLWKPFATVALGSNLLYTVLLAPMGAGGAGGAIAWR